MAENQALLAGRRVLIVEDEYLVADDVAAALRAAGATVVGPFGSLPAAERAVAEELFDCAVLDVNLRGRHSTPIAQSLDAAGVPTLVVTGYSRDALPDPLQAASRLEKPVAAREVPEALASLLRGART